MEDSKVALSFLPQSRKGMVVLLTEMRKKQRLGGVGIEAE